MSNTELMEGETIALSCSVDGSYPQATQIQWLKDGIPFLAATERITITTLPPESDVYGLYIQTSSLNISDTHPDEDSGVYTCKAFLSAPGVPSVSDDISITIQSNSSDIHASYSHNYCSFSVSLVRNECVVQIDPIMTPCVNGYCIDGFNTYICICDEGYMGRNCDEEGLLDILKT